MKELEKKPYFRLFDGDKVLLSEIKKDCEYVLPAIDIMLENSRLVAQDTLDGDTLLWVPDERK